MNHEKAWNALKETLRGRIEVSPPGTYSEALKSVLATMEELEKPPLCTVLTAIDTEHGCVALVGHLKDANPSSERIERYKKRLIKTKLMRYVVGYRYRTTPFNPYMPSSVKPEWDKFNEWRANVAPALHKETASKLKWTITKREWKGNEEYEAIGKETK